MAAISKHDYSVVLKQINGAIRVLEMYPPGHPATIHAMEKPFTALQEIFKDTDQLVINQVEGKIIINGKNIEGTDLLERLLEEFEDENLNSLTITKSLTKEELNKFLNFFVKPLGKATQTINLPEYIEQNDIQSIKIDQLRYELVTEDEVVVKSEVVEGADLKAELSQILKDNPDLLRDIFLNESGSKSGSGGGTGEGEGGGLGGGPDPNQLRKDIQEHMKSLSDDDLLSLLASSLERSLEKHRPEGKDSASSLNEVVDLVNKILQGREKGKLLPRVKKILSERGIVKKEHLDFLFEEKWLKSQEVLDELIRMIDKLGTEKVDFARLMFLWQRVISSEEIRIKSYTIDKLVSKLDSENDQIRDVALSVLEKALDQFIQENKEKEFTYIKDRLYEKIKDQLLPAGILRDCSRLLKIIFSEMIRRQEFKEAQKILLEYNSRLSAEVTCPDEVRMAAQNFIEEVSDESTLASLTSQLKEGIPFENIKLTEEILESLDGGRVAKKLLDIFTVNDRATRMSALRVLSRLGINSLSALSDLLSSSDTFVRNTETTLLIDEQWYKVRNAIYVLGNIADDESVKILSKLGEDADVRVRLEVIKALEKVARPESADTLLLFLNDEDDEVRRSAIATMATLADRRCLESLKQHFRHNCRDWKITLTAISKVGEEESIEFMLRILQKDEGIIHLASKQKDEIKITVLNILGKIGSSELAGEIEKFVKQRGKGLVNLLVKDRVTEAADRALKMLERKNKVNPKDMQKRRNLETKIVS